MTLVEVLVATCLMALFTTMVATAMVMAYRNYHLSEDKLVNYRNAATALDRISRRLALCRQVFAPAEWTIPPTATSTPLPPVALTATTPLVFAFASTRVPSGLQTVEYYLDKASPSDVYGNLVEIASPPGYPGSGAADRQILANHLSAVVATPQPIYQWHGYTMVELDMTVTLGQGPPLPLANHVPLQNVGTPVP